MVKHLSLVIHDGICQCLDCGKWTRDGLDVLNQVECTPPDTTEDDNKPEEVHAEA